MADYTPVSPGTSNWATPLNNILDEINAEVEAATAGLVDKLDTAAAPELIRDTMASALVAGSNVTITPNDGADTITISATGGGGGGGTWGTIAGILGDQTDLQTELDGKSNTGHTHTIANVTSLQTTLDGKSNTGHTHNVSDVNATGIASATTFLRGDGTWATPATGAAWGAVTGTITSQTDLWAQLANSPIRVYHDTDPDYPRPTTTRPVDWVGAVEPNNRDEDLDFWFEVSPSSAFEGPLDDYAVPFRAYSLRRLLTSYEGPAIRVRRGTDNAEQDIGFTVLGALNTTALQTFADTDSVYVTTWYDQSGGARHLTQTTTAAQPRIVSAGVIDTSGGLPSVVFDGTDDHLKSSTVGLFAAGATTMAAVMTGASATAAVFVSEHQAGGNGYYRLLRSSSANWNVQATNDTGTSMWASTVSGSNVFDGNRHQLFYIDSASTINTWKDGGVVHNAVAATRSGSTTPTIFSVGATGGTTPGGFVNGRLQEAVFWTSAITTSRTAISTEQKSYWGTP